MEKGGMEARGDGDEQRKHVEHNRGRVVVMPTGAPNNETRSEACPTALATIFLCVP
jgi:hypothetical protein